MADEAVAAAPAASAEGVAAVGAEAQAAAPAANAGLPGDTGGAAAAEKPAEGQGAEKPAGGDAAKPEGEARAEGEKTDGEKAPEGAPAEYAAFVVPEGVVVNEALTPELTALAKELNLPQEQAQKLFDLGLRQSQDLAAQFIKQNDQNMTVQRNAWADQSKADAEFGGDKFDASIATANRGLKQFGSPAFIELLTASGLSNHPEFVRTFVRIGNAIGEDGIVTGSGDGARTNKQDRSHEAIAGRIYKKA